jgi:hypothetical protein
VVRAASIGLLLWCVAPSAGAAPLRAAVRVRIQEREAWRKALRASGETLGADKILYHQFRDPARLEDLRAALTVPGGRSTALRRWVTAGEYPGIWTLEDPAGWFGERHGQALAIHVKDMVLYDADRPEHRKIYEAWRAHDAELRGAGAENRFAAAKDARGVSMAARLAGVHAPPEERFYRELGIAGVAHWDAYGRKCIILLNARAIEKVDL